MNNQRETGALWNGWLRNRIMSKKRACHVLVLCDSGGSLKMIAEANSMILLSPGDILSPLQDAQYCINREKHQTLKIVDARCYSCDEWQRLTRKPS
ncbi:signal transduction protein PmrD [Salmonella enterica subsp. enterica]|nr:signal transduction protein PmrD [Salmonella enterica subsp. enterica] [Salmonella enterica subsp. enterica serovar Menston]